MKGKIRLATKKDVDRIIELFNSDANIFENERLRFEGEDIEDYINKKLNKMFVYEIKKKIVGVLLAEFWKNYTYIHMMIVDKNYRGKGIGKSMLDHLEDYAKRQKIPLIEIFTHVNNKKMQHILEKRNFERGSKLYFYFKEL